jgi:hypothetical protein
LELAHKSNEWVLEPRRVSRRLFCLSHAPMADPASFE